MEEMKFYERNGELSLLSDEDFKAIKEMFEKDWERVKEFLNTEED